MKKRFGDLKKTAIFVAGHLKRPAILATLTVLICKDTLEPSIRDLEHIVFFCSTFDLTYLFPR